jgi:cell migration-inducing and hyaluronan-binding protein
MRIEAPPRLTRLLCVALLLTACTGEPTEPSGSGGPPAGSLRWSDAATWPGGAVPRTGDAVVIPEGRTVVLDVSPPALASLTVAGELVFGDVDLNLTSGWIMVHGTFRIGREEARYQRQARITLTGPAGEDVMGMGARVLGIMGGKLELHGVSRTGWTTLDATAPAGATQILLATTTDWRAGDRIVIASTDLNPLWVDEATVVSVQGRTLTLSAPLQYAHWGTTQSFGGATVDQRAEVGLLSRNIVIQGDPATAPNGLGGHIMVMQGGQARVEGVELYRMGQKATLARYPLHWHLSQAADGQYLRNSSIWKTNSRCVTIHGTDGLRIEDNVCYDHLGHGFFMEDGAESGNHLERNLGLVTRTPATAGRLLPSDATPATFWVTNPANNLIGNAAAGSQGFGFWYALPAQPTGLSVGRPDRPTRTPLGGFTSNVAHSNLRDGLHVDNGPLPDGTTATSSYRPRQIPAAESPVVTAVFRGFRAWKNSNRGVWFRGNELRLAGAVLSDNKIGATFAASETFVEDATFVGQTANTAGTQYPAGFPVRGYEFYDGRVGARRVTFINYTPGGGRVFSAIGFNRNNAFSLSPGNAVEQLTFVNSNRVYVENPNPIRDGDKAAVFFDADGSVTGTAGHFVAAVNPLHVTGSCVFRSEWNSYDCGNRFVRLQVRGINGELIGPATVRREDGANTTYVGSGNDPVSISTSLPVSRSYTVTPGGAPPLSPRFFATGMIAGDWLRVSVPYAGATVRVSRDYSTSVFLPQAASLAELDAGPGDRYYRDPGTGVLHLKLVPQLGRDYAVLYVTP